MSVSTKDKDILRELAGRIAEVAALPVHQEKRDMWTRLNRLERVRPMVFINEIPWHEIPEASRLQCEDEFCRGWESRFRMQLYCWDHMRCDMVVDPVVYSPYVIQDTGYELSEDSTRSGFEHGSRSFQPVIKDEADIEKIQMPRITPDWEATERDWQRAVALFGDLLPVEKRGVVHMWCAPWDILITWWGITELYMDMMDRPQFVHKGISRMMDALVSRLDQLEQMGLLSVSDGNHRVGSGGLGITDELPPPNHDPAHVRPEDQWGTSTGQIFSEVSPDMHDEFCLQYEKRWLERFGLNCYGCCEPLHNKMPLMRTIPNLRRVSMSPWIDIDKAADEVKTDYVFSLKLNPAVVAPDRWDPDVARRQVREALEKTRGCVVEVVMKDVSTCRDEPQRLCEWTQIVMEEVEAFG